MVSISNAYTFNQAYQYTVCTRVIWTKTKMKYPCNMTCQGLKIKYFDTNKNLLYYLCVVKMMLQRPAYTITFYNYSQKYSNSQSIWNAQKNVDPYFCWSWNII